MTIFSAALLLFLVMDPFGNLPLFSAALKTVDASRHNRIIIRELVIALLVLLIFLFFGQHLLKSLNISEPALTTAGGMVLFIIALRMIFPAQRNSATEEVTGEPFIVPLAIPYVAGPSAMASVLLIMSRDPGRWLEWLAALFIAWVASGLIIALSGLVARILKNRGLIAIERLSGMLLVAIAVQMILSGISEFIG